MNWSLLSSLLACCVALGLPVPGNAQTSAAPQSPASGDQIQQLSLQVQMVEQQLKSSEQELAVLKARLTELQASLAAAAAPVGSQPSPTPTPAAPNNAEAIAMQSSQIATLDQTKIETGSKFPLKVSGLLLMTASVNSRGVDSPVDATASLGGPGSTALSLRQTVLGFDANGPHLAGARSSADLRVDFYGSAAGSGTYPSVGGLLRLRTAHAALDWQHTQLFFAFDRTLLNPNTPTSLVQVAEPGLSWSGNLWNWMPQLGVSSRFGQRHAVVLQGAWVSPPDAPYPAPAYMSSASEPATLAEAGRVLGGEARIAYESGDAVRGLRIGVGGYVAPHTLPGIGSFKAWASTLDVRAPFGRYADFTGNLYRGAGLGGLGAGGYKDWIYITNGKSVYIRAPDAVGGWTQLSVHVRPTLDWNNAFGMDNVFGGQLRLSPSGAIGYGSIARNRTAMSNLIWSPRPYLPFSFEYRRLYSAPVKGPLWNTNVFAFGAGYRF